MNKADVEKVARKLKRLKELDYSTIIFLGAGASVTSGIPTAPGIVKFIKESKSFKQLISSNRNDYFDVMAELDSGERHRIFQHFIDNAKINETHFITALLVRLGYVDTVITTNFDPLVKNSLSLLLHSDPTIIDVINNVDTSGHELPSPLIIYIHGEYKNVWQLNTLKELEKNHKKVSNLLSQIAPKRAWIIVGYSGNDPVFDIILDFEKFEEGLFWIGYNDERPLDKVYNGLLRKPEKNTFYVEGYDSDNFFMTLFKCLEIKENELIEFIRRIPFNIKSTQKLSDKDLFNPKQSIQLTQSCETWINKIETAEEKFELKKKKWIYILIPYWLQYLLFGYDKSVIQVIRLIKTSQFDKAITATDKAIEENPQSPFAHYFKGIALGSKAEKLNPPSARKDIYIEMMESFKKAKEIVGHYYDRFEEFENIPKILTTVWAQEHNSAVEILTDDSVRDTITGPYDTAIAYLENAVVLKPGNSLSYVVLSAAYFRKGNVDKAISTYEKAMVLFDTPEIQDYDYLISLYLNQRMYEQAKDLSEEAVEEYPGETNFVRYLADSYFQVGETDRAIGIVRDLIESDPENPQYRMVLGTQVYQLVSERNEEINSKYNQLNSMRRQARHLSGNEQKNIEMRINDLKAEIEQMEQEVSELTEVAINEIEQVTELSPQDDNAFNILGIIYQNKAAALFEKRNSIDDNDLSSQYNQEARETLLNALKYYEKATEINSEKSEYWNAIHAVNAALRKNKSKNNL